MRLASPDSAIPPPPAEDADRRRFAFKLFVTGGTPRAAQAEAHLKRLCDIELLGHGDYQVIDVLERPRLAEDLRILVTPTLILEAPGLVRRVVGDLSDSQRVMVSLGLWPES